jgi:hypothetical protein
MDRSCLRLTVADFFFLLTTPSEYLFTLSVTCAAVGGSEKMTHVHFRSRGYRR